MKTIGLIGNCGAGKDTYGNYLFRALKRLEYSVLKQAFADELYAIAHTLYGIPKKEVCDEYPILKNQMMPYGRTVRETLNFLGEAAKEIDPKVWVNQIERTGNYCSFLILTDVRFKAEAELCDELVYISRQGCQDKIGDVNYDKATMAVTNTTFKKLEADARIYAKKLDKADLGRSL